VSGYPVRAWLPIAGERETSGCGAGKVRGTLKTQAVFENALPRPTAIKNQRRQSRRLTPRAAVYRAKVRIVRVLSRAGCWLLAGDAI
jgi:hypothetical protein